MGNGSVAVAFQAHPADKAAHKGRHEGGQEGGGCGREPEPILLSAHGACGGAVAAGAKEDQDPLAVLRAAASALQRASRAGDANAVALIREEAAEAAMQAPHAVRCKWQDLLAVAMPQEGYDATPQHLAIAVDVFEALAAKVSEKRARRPRSQAKTSAAAAAAVPVKEEDGRT